MSHPTFPISHMFIPVFKICRRETQNHTIPNPFSEPPFLHPLPTTPFPPPLPTSHPTCPPLPPLPQVSESAAARAALRELFASRAVINVSTISSKQGGVVVKSDAKPGSRGQPASSSAKPSHAKPHGKPGGKPSDYSSLDGLQRRAATLSAHRILAMNRAESEKAVRVSVEVPGGIGSRLARERALPANTSTGGAYRAKLLASAADDAYERLLQPAMRRELRRRLTEVAEEAAAKVFARNLRSLLLQPPLPNVTILGIDPGLRTGCKLAAISSSGAVLEAGVVHAHAPAAVEELARWLRRHRIDVRASLSTPFLPRVSSLDPNFPAHFFPPHVSRPFEMWCRHSVFSPMCRHSFCRCLRSGTAPAAARRRSLRRRRSRAPATSASTYV